MSVVYCVLSVCLLWLPFIVHCWFSLFVVPRSLFVVCLYVLLVCVACCCLWCDGCVVMLFVVGCLAVVMFVVCL